MTARIKTYIETIKEIYGEYMGKENLQRLNDIKDYGECVFIKRYGEVNAFATKEGVFLPVDGYDTIEQLKMFEEYGKDKCHKLYTDETLVINENTFYDYIKHVVLTASSVEDYYEDLLLHETMHFCGSGGGSALKEGINEYLTRKTALKNGFRTSACGYPKEVKVAYELEKIFGERIIDKIAFIKNEENMLQFIENEKGKEARKLFEKIMLEMGKEFHYKYHSHMREYNGVEGIKKKADNYKKIDYSKTYVLIEKYKKKNMRK